MNFKYTQQRSQNYPNYHQSPPNGTANQITNIDSVHEIDIPNYNTFYFSSSTNAPIEKNHHIMETQTSNWCTNSLEQNYCNKLFQSNLKSNRNISNGKNSKGHGNVSYDAANDNINQCGHSLQTTCCDRNILLSHRPQNGTEDIITDKSFLSNGENSNSYQYLPLANSSAAYYYRNRYTPYTHNGRICSSAATTLPPHLAHITTITPNSNSNILLGMNSHHQMQPLVGINYNNNQACNINVCRDVGATTATAVTTNNILTSLGTYAPEEILINMNSFETKSSNSINNISPTTTIKKSDTNDTSTTVCFSNVNNATNAVNTTSIKCNNITGTSTTTIDTKQTYITAIKDINQLVTLQITNLDYTMDENSLRNFLLGQLNPITPVISLTFEGTSYAKVTVPDLFFAKQVVSNLHRKKIGHKRMLVSYTRDSSLTETKTLRCQVAGLLKDVPYYTLPMYKFRELFQSRFKTSISVLDLYKMPDICTINTDSNDEKVISLRPELIDSLDTSPLVEGLQHSVPYCTTHFKREQHKGWAEQEIEPLPNIYMTISELQKIIYPLLNSHPGDIPIASLLHCIEGQLNVHLVSNENGVNLEHLVCCIQGIQIQVNNFGIKILGWIEVEKNSKEKLNCDTNTTAPHTSIITTNERVNMYTKNYVADSLYLISREVIELIKMSPKSTMKFNRFIPAYHNHFGKQCRVADYGYTKLIELFEALSTVVQIMGDGENRQITLTHRIQMRRFTSDLLRVLRAHGNKSVLLSQLPTIFTQTQYRSFNITDYGVCDIIDILDGLVHSNVVVLSTVQQGKDILISMPRRKQTSIELEKTSVFAGEMVELFSTAPQYAILFQKFVRSYHYHFAYQCRLSDYGFLKLADLMEAIQGIVELEVTNDENKKIFLSSRVAQRVFSEQCGELVRSLTGSSQTCIKFTDVLDLHKKKFGYQIQPQTLGVQRLEDAIELLPYVEVLEKENQFWIICHNTNTVFRTLCYRAMKHVLHFNHSTVQILGSTEMHNAVLTSEDNSNQLKKVILLDNKLSGNISLVIFLQQFNKQYNENLTVQKLKAMRQFIEIYTDDHQSSEKYVRLSKFSKFLLHIVYNLEQKSNVVLHDLKQAVDCHLSSTFEFGYPNLFSVLTAYPDLFAVNINTTQERSEIKLLSMCELRSSANNCYTISTRLSSSHNNKLKSSIRTRNAFGDCESILSAFDDGPPPYKTRTLVEYDTLYQNTTGHLSTVYSHNLTNVNVNSRITSNNNNIPNKNRCYSSTAQQLKNFLNISTSNKENSLEASFTILNTSLNSSSNCSLLDYNSSFDTTNTSSTNSSMSMTPQYAINQNATKLWERRRLSPYHLLEEKHLQLLNKSSLVSKGNAQTSTNIDRVHNTSIPVDQSGIYEYINNVKKCPNYEPPKPDTPPSVSMPFWIDPIWMHNKQGDNQNHELQLSIKLPEMRVFNVLPMLLSPYTLSKTENMKQEFNFENHDRKIA